MPELPEVQAHAERLDAAWRGSVLGGFEALSFTALKTVTPAPEVACGAALDAVTRRGKLLLLRFGELCFVVHLMQGGRLGPQQKPAARPKGGVARWRFDDERALLLSEAGTERKAGVWVIAGDPEAQEPLAGLGPDADALDAGALAARLAGQRGRIHTVLRDQQVVAGLGRRLANEIAHRAGLSPFARTDQLAEADLAQLAAAVGDTLAADLDAERARADMSRAAERSAAVHGRAGEACPACADTVRSVEYRDYTVAYCPTCQTGGRVLADNAYSRLGVARADQPARRARRRS